MFVAAFPTGPSVCWGGGGGGGGGQQASSLSSKHKLWNFHRYLLVSLIVLTCSIPTSTISWDAIAATSLLTMDLKFLSFLQYLHFM